MSLLQNSNAISSGSYDINNSLRFRSSASAYLSRTPASAGNRKTWTWSTWFKRGNLNGNDALWHCYGSATNTTYFLVRFETSNALYIGNASTSILTTTQVFRDPSAWYHIVITMDTTQATANNRLKLYVNGSQVTAFATNNISAQIAQNSDQGINQASVHTIGRENSGVFYLDGYLSELNFVDGQALTPSSFGETDTTTGSWKPKAYTSTYGTNGFYLKFSDIATTSGSNAGLGKDFSGNTNYWTTNNISVTAGTTYDAMTDSPTLTSATVANYCTWNPLDALTASTFQNGNLQITTPSAGGGVSRATMGLTGNKFYWEVVGTTNGNYLEVGILKSTDTSASYLESQAGGYSYLNNGQKCNNGTAASYGNSYTTNDVIGVAFDATTGSLYFSKNGTWQNSGDPVAGTGYAYTGLTADTYMPAISDSANTISTVASVNFGQRPFSYTPPTGFVALNTFNLPTPTILQGNTAMNAIAYTGNGSTQTVTGLSFASGMLWIKDRSAITNHQVNDEVRGVGRELQPDATSAETNNNIVTAFNSNGFSISSNGNVNANGNSYVAWSWKANGAGSSNTSGTITSSVSANTTAGFSVVTYTGTGANATVGHGLGVAPSWVIVKRRNSTGNWNVRHVSIAAANSLYLNLTNASQSDPTVWNSTVPTSTVFSIGTDTGVNASGGTYVAYCWAAISGYSAFGSYTGNSSADGPFVYLGFRPEFIIVKRSDSPNYWVMQDSSRSTFNVVDKYLAADDPLAEATSAQVNIDFLSNGFKVRSTFDIINAGTYIYMAFAENPFKNANAR